MNTKENTMVNGEVSEKFDTVVKCSECWPIFIEKVEDEDEDAEIEIPALFREAITRNDLVADNNISDLHKMYDKFEINIDDCNREYISDLPALDRQEFEDCYIKGGSIMAPSRNNFIWNWEKPAQPTASGLGKIQQLMNFFPEFRESDSVRLLNVFKSLSLNHKASWEIINDLKKMGIEERRAYLLKMEATVEDIDKVTVESEAEVIRRTISEIEMEKEKEIERLKKEEKTLTDLQNEGNDFFYRKFTDSFESIFDELMFLESQIEKEEAILSVTVHNLKNMLPEERWVNLEAYESSFNTDEEFDFDDPSETDSETISTFGNSAEFVYRKINNDLNSHVPVAIIVYKGYLKHLKKESRLNSLEFDRFWVKEATRQLRNHLGSNYYPSKMLKKSSKIAFATKRIEDSLFGSKYVFGCEEVQKWENRWLPNKKLKKLISVIRKAKWKTLSKMRSHFRSENYQFKNWWTKKRIWWELNQRKAELESKALSNPTYAKICSAFERIEHYEHTFMLLKFYKKHERDFSQPIRNDFWKKLKECRSNLLSSYETEVLEWVKSCDLPAQAVRKELFRLEKEFKNHFQPGFFRVAFGELKKK